MSTWFCSYKKLLVASLLIFSISLVGAGAQKRKKRTRRTSKPAAAKPVITNPDIAPAPATDGSGDVKIISTADQAEAAENPQNRKQKTAVTPANSEQQEMQKTINTLSNQVNKLTDKLTEIQEDDRYQLDMERLTRAEQRAEQIRSQLIDTQTKIADLEAKLEEVEWSLKPENIERVTQGMGTLRPEEVRETKRRQLENEKSRLQAQLKILETSKARLETSSVNADGEVDALRAKLEQRRQQIDNNSSATSPKKPEPRDPLP